MHHGSNERLFLFIGNAVKVPHHRHSRFGDLGGEMVDYSFVWGSGGGGIFFIIVFYCFFFLIVLYCFYFLFFIVYCVFFGWGGVVDFSKYTTNTPSFF